MSELHDAVDKLFTEVDHLDRLLPDDAAPDEQITPLALAVAKRVRNAATLVVRQLAAHRDNPLQP